MAEYTTKGLRQMDKERAKKRGKLERQYMGWVFIAPWLIGFLIFKLYPMMSSLVFSFSDYHLFRGIRE